MLFFAVALLFASFIGHGHGYCWQPGANPWFSGAPTVTQVDLETVKIEWNGIVEEKECADQVTDKIKHLPLAQ